VIISEKLTWLYTNDTNKHELKGNIQKAPWRFYNQCSFVKSVAGVIILFLFGSGYAGLGFSTSKTMACTDYVVKHGK